MAIIKVPLELRTRFYSSRANFVRDICCYPMDAIRPFFKRKTMLERIYDAERQNPLDEKLLRFYDWYTPINLEAPRYLHFDLGVTQDNVGIACTHASHFVERTVTKEGETRTTLVPFIYFDFLGRIEAPKGHEIILEDVVNVVYQFARYGAYVRLVTFDGFQSVSSIQSLNRDGFTSARLSIQRTANKIIVDPRAENGWRKESTEKQYIAAMQSLKDIVYQTRGSVPNHPYYFREAKGAEYDEKMVKVDHLPNGTIDMLQAMAGATFNCENNSYPPVDESEFKGSHTKIEDNFYEEHNYSDLGKSKNEVEDSFYKEIEGDYGF